MRCCLLLLTLILGGFGWPREGLAQTRSFDLKRGTTGGLLNRDPLWSAGIQAGGNATTGLTVQKVNFFGGAMNAGIGYAFGGFALHGDYLLYLETSFRRARVTRGYNGLRARLHPYVGAGIQAGRGIAARAPLGVQYTMYKDPVGFFGEVTPVIGPLLGEDDEDPIRLGYAAGIRGLL